MQKEPNHKCKNCGAEYYACRNYDSVGAGYWKAAACSIECFDAYTKAVLKAREGNLTKEESVDIYKPDLVETTSDVAEEKPKETVKTKKKTTKKTQED